MKERYIQNLKLILLSAFIGIISVFILRFCVVSGFFDDVENKTFDLRQKAISSYKHPNSDIVILSIDDGSYEYIVSKYGAYPAPRDFWAKITNEIRKYNPKAIIYDLVFVQNFKAFGNTDNTLVEAVKNSDNVYLSMNFDNQNPEIRTPIDLPDSIKTNVTGNTSKLKSAEYVTYSNVRPIMPGLLYGTKNIGFINIMRDKDGIIRSKLPLFVYKNDFYKHLTLLAGLDLLNIDSKNLFIDKNNNIVLKNNTKIPVDDEGRVILNWYNIHESYKHIPIWETDKAIDEGNSQFLKDSFKDKIVYVGTTATSSSDIKSTPVFSRTPGVDVHATFLNNILDNNFIKKTSFYTDLTVSFLIALLTILIAIKYKSVLKSSSVVFFINVFYILLSLVLMAYFNIWIVVFYPILCSVLAYSLSYAVKYVITSRDYEHTYKLAVTDGLTELYNHRYFQEQMKLNINNAKRYNSPFSLIMIDIDFFKKFNDTYGHQSGDAVLRQVAMTIKKNIRSTDIPCRYGGEEMAIILTNTLNQDAFVVAQKICEAVRATEFELAGGNWTHVTISLGVSTMRDDVNTIEGMIEYADKCLYKAKENGRNQVVNEP